MVKGLSRQVIIVDSPDPELFEQAIFIVRKDVADKKCVTQECLLGEARRIVQGYCRMRRTSRARWSTGKAWLWSIIGIGGMLLGWGIRTLFAI